MRLKVVFLLLLVGIFNVVSCESKTNLAQPLGSVSSRVISAAKNFGVKHPIISLAVPTALAIAIFFKVSIMPRFKDESWYAERPIDHLCGHLPGHEECQVRLQQESAAREAYRKKTENDKLCHILRKLLTI